MQLLNKSQFLLYLDAPLHLWAQAHHQSETKLSLYEQHLAQQGYQVEKQAQKYLEKLVASEPALKLIWQATFTDKNYEVRSDALIFHEATNSYDLYEIKSSTSVDKNNLYDATFQFLVLNKKIKLDHVYILHLNKDYARQTRLNLQQLFIAEEVTAKVHALKIKIDLKREKAWQVLNSELSEGISACYNIKTCPCLSLCHPNLPPFSIFHLPHLSVKKKQALLDLNIIQAQDVPANFPLSYKQSLIAKVAKSNQPIIDRAAIRHELEQLTFPLYFLDYETYNAAITLFDGYHPQQAMVFQYSLHILESPEGKLKHREHLSLGKEDPARSLLAKLQTDIGPTGSVLVWNKSFEMTRNKELAELYPVAADFLNDLNELIYDLADSIIEGFYVHPQFKGSWSIKNVLPVLVPNLSYHSLAIKKGDEAMIAWWKLVNQQYKNPEKITANLLSYCELDTRAMVKIWERMRSLVDFRQ